MTLFNTDKNSHNRLSPTVSSHDVHLAPKAHGTDSFAPRVEGSQAGARITTKDDRITVYDDDDARIIIGRLPDGTYGIAVSKIGEDVITDAFS